MAPHRSQLSLPSLSRQRRLVGMGLALGLVAVLGLGLIYAVPRLAHAATITISTCDYATLSSAISSASSGDTLQFGCNGTINVTATLTISKDLTLDGTGHSVTLDGGGVQVLLVNSGVSFTLNDLTVAHGSSVSGGGGLFNSGTVTITNSVFSSNRASVFGGGGGGLYNDSGATATITGSTFSGNSALDSGVLYTGIGGGIYNRGSVTITGSTFAGNSATAAGGGLHNDSGATATIVNSTFTSNDARFGGGGLFTYQGTATITNSTFARNDGLLGPGNLVSNGGTLTTINSIVANSTSQGIVTNNNCGGTITDGGYNLDSGTTCGFSAAHHSLPSTDPKLAPLGNYGGPTQTMALLAGSPAIDQIPNSGANCPATDQRGVSRPQPAGGKCDIGAYEVVTAATALTANPNPALQGQNVALCATVTSPSSSVLGTPAGNVTFKDGATPLGTAALSAGHDCLNTSSLALGSHSITASYLGNGTYQGSTSTPVTVVIGVNGADVAGTVDGNSGVQASNGGATGNAAGASSASASGQQSQSSATSGVGTIASTSSTQPSVSDGWPTWLGFGLGLLLLLVGLGGLGAVFMRAARH